MPKTATWTETAAQDLAEAILAKDRWRQQESAYNKAIQERQDELYSAMMGEPAQEVEVPGFRFTLALGGTISIARVR